MPTTSVEELLRDKSLEVNQMLYLSAGVMTAPIKDKINNDLLPLFDSATKNIYSEPLDALEKVKRLLTFAGSYFAWTYAARRDEMYFLSQDLYINSRLVRYHQYTYEHLADANYRADLVANFLSLTYLFNLSELRELYNKLQSQVVSAQIQASEKAQLKTEAVIEQQLDTEQHETTQEEVQAPALETIVRPQSAPPQLESFSSYASSSQSFDDEWTDSEAEINIVPGSHAVSTIEPAQLESVSSSASSNQSPSPLDTEIDAGAESDSETEATVSEPAAKTPTIAKPKANTKKPKKKKFKADRGNKKTSSVADDSSTLLPEPLTLQQQITKCIAELDHLALVRLVEENKEDIDFTESLFNQLSALIRKNFKRPEEKFLEFLQAVNFPAEECFQLLQNKDAPLNIRKILLQKILNCNEHDFFILNQIATATQNDSDDFLKIATSMLLEDCKSTQGDREEKKEFYRKIYAKINERRERIKQWADNNINELFKRLNALDPNARISEADEYLLKIFADHQNSQGKTALMIALQNNKELPKYNIKIITILANASIYNLWVRDADGMNFMDYWAKFFNPKNGLLILKSLVKRMFMVKTSESSSRQASVTEIASLLRKLIYESESNGNTFLHHFIKGGHEERVVLKVLEELDALFPGKGLYPMFIIANNHGETISSIIDSREADCPLVIDYMYKRIPEFIFHVNHANQNFPEQKTRLFRKGGTLFAPSATKDAMLGCYENKDIGRLLKVAERRYALRHEISRIYIQLFSELDAVRKASFARNHESMLCFIGDNELSFLTIDGRPLLSLLADYMIKEDGSDPALLKSYLKSLTILDAGTRCPIIHTLEWKFLESHIDKGEELKIPDQFTQRLTFLVNIEDKHGLTALNYAILKCSPRLVIFLIEHCQAEVNDKIIRSSLTMDMSKPEAQDIIDYLFAKREFNDKPENKDQITPALFEHALITCHNVSIVKWLMAQDFNPTLKCTDGCGNALQLTLLLITMQKPDLSFELCEALLSDDRYKDSLLNNNAEGNSSLDILAEISSANKISAEYMIKFFDLFLSKGATAISCVTSKGRNLLYVPAVLESKELLAVFEKHIPKSDLVAMLQNQVDDKTVIQEVEERGQVEFAAELTELQTRLTGYLHKAKHRA